MGANKGQTAWSLARAQQGVVSREQLLTLGFTDRAIKHRIERGRLHPMWPGVYHVGSPYPSRLAVLMGAVIACGDGAAASHPTGGSLLGLLPWSRELHVSVPAGRHPRPKGVIVHRRTHFETTTHSGIPVTTPAQTIADIAPGMTAAELDRVISDADFRGIVEVPSLLRELEGMRAPGAARVRRLIHRRTFATTRSELERRFLRIVRRHGLPQPLTCAFVNGFEVDFHWPDLRLVVEAAGGAAHRTPAQQRADRRRDHAHLAAGFTSIRFTHDQIAHEPDYVGTYMSSIVSASSPTSRNCV